MLKNVTKIFVFVFFSILPGSLFAAEAVTMTGDAKIEGQTYQTPVNIMGQAEIKNSKIDNSLNVFGKMDAKHTEIKMLNLKGDGEFDDVNIGQANIDGKAEFEKSVIAGDLNINGDADFEKSKMQGNLSLVGKLTADETSFLDLTVKGKEITLDNSAAQNIVIKQMDDPNQEQVLKLKGGTDVLGKITFESGKGVVILESKKVKINDVQGAQIRREG